MSLPDHIRPGKGILLPALLMAVILLFAGAHSVSARDPVIKATAGAGGGIDPDGDVKVRKYNLRRR